jgi:predicted metalloendopeptidase
MVCTPGWLQYVQDAGTDSEEALLGIIGTTLAHELGHAYDPNGSMYNSRGEYEPWMSEEERALYDEKAQQIADFLDGWETEYGLTIDGELVVNETYADLMAVECCLRILAEKEDPDYDAFFRAYAEDRAAYYTEEELEKALTDTHLPGKERINLVLGQFDQFYETYDIDENSPYYVKEADRLSVF